jgi:hypothetical protein
MRTPAHLWLASPSIPTARRLPLRKLITTVLNLALDASEAVRQVVRRPGKSPAWREDLPWNVGLDHLAETGYPPFVPRGN